MSMGHVNVILEGDNALQDWASHKDGLTLYSQQDAQIRAIYLTGGMVSGKPACMIAARSPGLVDKPVVIELSVEMLLSIAAAFQAKYEQEGFVWR